MPTTTRWDDILPTITVSDGTWTTTTGTPAPYWTTWTYSSPSTPTTYDFPELETYNLESPKGREKYVSALNNYLDFYFFVKNPK